MKLYFEGFEVEIKAKRETSGRFNKMETAEILNLFSIYAGEAAERYKQLGMYALEKEARKNAAIIYEKLDTEGFYN